MNNTFGVNRENIKKIITGESFTKKTFGYEKNDYTGPMMEGESTIIDGTKFIKKDGILVSERTLRRESQIKSCKKCNKMIYGDQLDIKMYSLYEECFDCTIEKHTQMKIDGTWETFENKKILERQLSFLKDSKESMKYYLENELTKTIKFVNEDGTFTEFDNENYENFKKMLEKELVTIDSDIELITKELEKLDTKLEEPTSNESEG